MRFDEERTGRRTYLVRRREAIESNDPDRQGVSSYKTITKRLEINSSSLDIDKEVFMFDLGIIHAPIWEGQAKPGVAFGPETLEQSGLYQLFFERSYNYKVYKPQNKWLSPPTNSFPEREHKSSYYKSLEPKYKKIHDLMSTAYNECRLPILLGGDHSSAISSISALLKKYPQAGILWIDAHADLNTFETSPTGNIHGMPVAALSGLIPKSKLFSGDWMCHHLNFNQIVYMGIRDLDQGELDILKSKNILAFTAKDLTSSSINSTFTKIQDHFYSHGFTQGLHISFDIDGLDASLVPSTGTPSDAGLSLKDLEEILKLTLEYFELTSVDCVEFNPRKTKSKEDVLKTYQSIYFFFQKLLSNPRFMVDRHIFKKVQQSPMLSHNKSILS